MEGNSKNAAHGWHADEVNDKCERLEPCGVMNESNEDTKDSVQVCSILHVVQVHVLRVILVVVHNGLPMLKVCLWLYTLLRSPSRSHLFVNCCIKKNSLYTS